MDKNLVCPKCKSKIIWIFSIEYLCMSCGHHWPVFKTYIKKNKEEDYSGCPDCDSKDIELVWIDTNSDEYYKCNNCKHAWVETEMEEVKQITYTLTDKLKKDHKKFKKMTIVPKITKNNIMDLFIDIWKFYKKEEDKNNDTK